MGLVDLESTDFIGKPIKTALKHHGISGFEPLLSKDGDQVTEISLGSPSRPQQVHVSCAVRTMNSPSGSEKGRMLIFSDQSKLRDIEQRLSLHERMAAMLADPSEEFTSISTGSEENRIIGESQSMKDIYSLLQKVSGSEASVLISGESGTGKELIARAIHANSPRSSKPFVAINCGAIPENLIESEFFGHKKGAFTGAVNESIGLFRQAEGGTVFLDEVGELPLHLQTKLLRVLQEKAVRAVGDTLDIEVDVRIVAATNKVLKQEVAEGRFRDDLYYRLNVVNISLPALRARREDIPFLVKHFVEEFSCDRESVPAVSPEALQLLLDYDYPGNIRELENIIERALVLGGNAILAEHLPRDVLYQERSLSSGGLSHYNQDLLQQTADSVALPVDLDAELAKLEQLYLDLALSQSQGVKKNAAKLLGLNFRSFRYRLKKYSQETTENDAHVS
jgi:two-component system response regulator PilR (NtrC family)